MSSDPHKLPEANELASLQKGMLRPAESANMDGTFELGWGAALLCFAAVPYVHLFLPKSSWTAWAGFLLLLCGALAPCVIPKIIKRLFTWPRTGYVAGLQEVKVSQVLLIIIFGAALGNAAALLFKLIHGIRHVGNVSNREQVLLPLIGCIFCAAIVLFLWRKVIRKREPLPTAYDANQVREAFKQTAAGKKTLRTVRGRLALLFVGVPVVVCAVVYGLMRVSGWQLRESGMSWQEWGFLGFLVAANAVLFLMGNAVSIRQHRWKWVAVLALIVGPLWIAPVIPVPASGFSELPILQQFPPVMATIAILWLLSGAITLCLFVLRNPRISVEAA